MELFDVRLMVFPLQTGLLPETVGCDGVWLTTTVTDPAAEVQPLRVAVTV